MSQWWLAWFSTIKTLVTLFKIPNLTQT